MNLEWRGTQLFYDEIEVGVVRTVAWKWYWVVPENSPLGIEFGMPNDPIPTLEQAKSELFAYVEEQIRKGKG